MRVVNAGEFTQRFPCFNRHMTVGFRREGQDHFGRINRGIEFWLTFTRTFGGDFVQATQDVHFVLGFPSHAFAAIANFFQQRPDRGEFIVNLAVIALHHGHHRHGFARNRFAFAFFPVFHVERLPQLLR